ncbi:MAG: cyanophycinase [Crocinitomicaceae bacterium]|jgi:cyanophycinase|nr:cyanophycinase [Crocinitomicaceae bacterium]
MMPKGKLIIIGGALDKGSFTENTFADQVEENLNFFEKGILKRIIDESKHQKNSRIEIVPTASKVPDIVGVEYARAFGYLGAENVGVLNVENREDALSPEALERITNANVIFFTGGDQLRLTSIFGGTPIHDLLLKKYLEEDFLYVGTSAGAACASKNMIYQGSSREALLKGEIKITSGLGFMDNVIIDTHFVQRGRIGRLFQAVVGNPKTLGIGLGEDTGLLIKNGVSMEALGSGLVIIVDGRQILDSNISDVALGEPISIKNLVVHVMSQGDVYCLETNDLTINNKPSLE